MDITTRFNVGEVIQINKQRAIDTFERLLAIGLKKYTEESKSWGFSKAYIKENLSKTENDVRNGFYSTLKTLDRKFIVLRFDIKYRWDYKNVEVDTTIGEYSEKVENKSLKFLYNHTEKIVLKKSILDDEHFGIMYFSDDVWNVLKREELYDVVGVHKED